MSKENRDQPRPYGGQVNLARRFNDYCRASSDWIWEIDATGRFIFSSDRSRDFFDVSPSSIVGTQLSSWGQFVDADENKIEVNHSEPFSGQLFQTTGHSGPALMLEVSGVPLMDRETKLFKGVIGTCKDITRQHEAEQSLRAANEELEKKVAARTRSLIELNERLAKEVNYHSETKKKLNESLSLFQAIAETSPVAMFISDMSDQTIRFSNDKASELLKLGPSDLAEKKITELFFDPYSRRVVRQLVDPDRSQGVHQIRYKTPDGTMKWGQLSTHMMWIDNEPVLLTAVMDISDLKNADRQIAHQSRLATLGELSASIVHEINQPLSIMGMAIETALDAAGAEDEIGDPKTVRSKLMALLQEQRRLVKISDRMRSYSRKVQPEADWFSVNQSCEYVVNFMAEDFKRRGIVFDVDLPEERFFVIGVPTALEQVFMNVLANARDAVEEHSAKSDSDSYQMKISFSARVDDNKSTMEFRIWNNGSAIPDNLIEDIFLPFVSTKDSKSGTGLGLSVCKRLIVAMSGTIKAVNTPDGVEFLITVPCKSREAAFEAKRHASAPRDNVVVPPARRQEKRNEAPGRLLIVDDEPELRNLMKTFLENAGYTVVTAADGAAALEKSESDNFDVIITDLNMPKMDGAEFIRIYRDRGGQTPIIVVSSMIASRNDSSLELDGIQTFTKPVDYDALVSAINDTST